MTDRPFINTFMTYGDCYILARATINKKSRSLVFGSEHPTTNLQKQKKQKVFALHKSWPVTFHNQSIAMGQSKCHCSI